MCCVNESGILFDLFVFWIVGFVFFVWFNCCVSLVIVGDLNSFLIFNFIFNVLWIFVIKWDVRSECLFILKKLLLMLIWEILSIFVNKLYNIFFFGFLVIFLLFILLKLGVGNFFLLILLFGVNGNFFSIINVDGII